MRADSVINGIPVVTIVNGPTYYAIDGRSLVGTAIERAPKALANDQKGGRPFLNDGERMIAMGAEKISSEDLHLDWSRTAVQLKRVVRLGHAWTTFRGKRLTVLAAAVASEDPRTDGRRPGALAGALVATGGGSLQLRRVQPESRSPMSADEWLRGVRAADGERLGTE